MMKKIIDRLFEPSTYAGLGMFAVALGQFADIKEIPLATGAANTMAQAVTANPTWQGLIFGALGIAAMFLPERGLGRGGK